MFPHMKNKNTTAPMSKKQDKVAASLRDKVATLDLVLLEKLILIRLR